MPVSNPTCCQSLLIHRALSPLPLVGSAVVVLCASSKHESRDARPVATDRCWAVCVGACVCVWVCLFVRLCRPGRKVAIYTDAACARRWGHGRRPGHTAFMCRCSGTVNKCECSYTFYTTVVFWSRCAQGCDPVEAVNAWRRSRPSLVTAVKLIRVSEPQEWQNLFVVLKDDKQD